MKDELIKKGLDITDQAFINLLDAEQVEFIQTMREHLLQSRSRRIEEMQCQMKEMDARVDNMKKNNEKI